MKRFISILLLLSLLLSGCGSTENTTETGKFLFYYPAEDPHGAEAMAVIETPFEDTLPAPEELVVMYFSAELPEGALSPIDGGQLTVTFTGRDIEPIRESQTLGALTQTFCQLEEIHRVKLCPPGEREPLLLSENDLLLEDMGMFPREELVLYFPDEEQRYLRRETFVVDSLGEKEKPAYIINRLLEGTGEMRSCIPRGTKLLDIQVENGVCTVDLSSEFVENMPKPYRIARLAVYSIVNSLTELDGISMVDIQVAHSSVEQLEYMDLSKGLRRNELLLASNNGYDGSIYPYAKDSELLVEIPIWLREDGEHSVEELVLGALLEYEGDHSVCHSIPKGTSILSVRMAENTCVVDLTAEFTDLSESPKSQRLAVYSIVATLSALPHVDAVEILVEGNRPRYHIGKLREIRVVDPEWFAEGEF